MRPFNKTTATFYFMPHPRRKFAGVDIIALMKTRQGYCKMITQNLHKLVKKHKNHNKVCPRGNVAVIHKLLTDQLAITLTAFSRQLSVLLLYSHRGIFI